MKKTILILLIFLAGLSCSAQEAKKDTTAKPQTPYFITGDIELFNALMAALEKSKEEHATIVILQSWISNQIDKQYRDKQKAAAPKSESKK